MTFEQIGLAVLGFGLSVLGWFARELWNAVQTLREQLRELEVKISENYVRYDRMQDVMKPIIDQLTRIEDQLLRKVDK